MKLSVKKICNIFVRHYQGPNKSWSYYTYLPDSCPAVLKHFKINDRIRCEDCKNKIIYLKEIKNKAKKNEGVLVLANKRFVKETH